VKEKETSIKQNYQAKCKRKNYKQLTNNKEAHRTSCTNKNEIQILYRKIFISHTNNFIFLYYKFYINKTSSLLILMHKYDIIDVID
jgi:hypothetical protein